jgi:TonB family protein
MEHRVWVGALMLEVVLPLCRLQLGEAGRQAWRSVLWFRQLGLAGGQVRVILSAGVASPVALPRLTAAVLAAVALAYVCGLLYFAGRMGWGVWTTETMRRRALRLKLSREAAIKIGRFEALFGIGEGEVLFASSSAISGPATVGVRPQTLLLPPGFLDRLSSDDLDAVLAHEFAHMRRWDFAKNLLYGIVSLPAAYHPLMALTRARLAETRELVCDAAAAEAVGGRERYARSLLSLASMLSDCRTPRILHAIGILDANIFERRVMHLTRRSLQIRGARRFAIAIGCALVAVVTCTSALALRMDVTEPTSQNPATPEKTVKAADAAQNLLSHVMPVYPPEAKKDKVTGSVVLAAIIGKDGTVENLRVVSGPEPLQKSAVDAVRQWTYKPFLLNGNPIEIKTTITVIYTLAE